MDPVSHSSSASRMIRSQPASERAQVRDRDADRPFDVDADARHPGQARRIGERAELRDDVARRGLHRSAGTSQASTCRSRPSDPRRRATARYARSVARGKCSPTRASGLSTGELAEEERHRGAGRGDAAVAGDHVPRIVASTRVDRREPRVGPQGSGWSEAEPAPAIPRGRSSTPTIGRIRTRRRRTRSARSIPRCYDRHRSWERRTIGRLGTSRHALGRGRTRPVDRRPRRRGRPRADALRAGGDPLAPRDRRARPVPAERRPVGGRRGSPSRSSPARIGDRGPHAAAGRGSSRFRRRLVVRSIWVGSPTGTRLLVFLGIGLAFTLLFLLAGPGVAGVRAGSDALPRRPGT